MRESTELRADTDGGVDACDELVNNAVMSCDSRGFGRPAPGGGFSRRDTDDEDCEGEVWKGLRMDADGVEESDAVLLSEVAPLEGALTSEDRLLPLSCVVKAAGFSGSFGFAGEVEVLVAATGNGFEGDPEGCRALAAVESMLLRAGTGPGVLVAPGSNLQEKSACINAYILLQ